MIGTEHLLAGLLGDPSSRAVRLLADAGLAAGGDRRAALHDDRVSSRRLGVGTRRPRQRITPLRLRPVRSSATDDRPPLARPARHRRRAARRSTAASTSCRAARGRTASRRIAATPHVRHDFPTTPGADGARRRGAAGGARRASGIAVDVLPGGELDLDVRPSRSTTTTLRRFGLGGNPPPAASSSRTSAGRLALHDLVLPTSRATGVDVGARASRAEPRGAGPSRAPARARRRRRLGPAHRSVRRRAAGGRNAAARGGCSTPGSRI